MKNRITISIPFSFRGQTFEPACTVDLDAQMERSGSLPNLYTHLASEAGIDEYSYEHDVMMMGEMLFDQAEGLAAECLNDGAFDVEGFEKAWQQQRLDGELAAIAERHLGLESLDEAPDMKQALLDAYELGRQAGRSGNQIRSTPPPGF